MPNYSSVEEHADFARAKFQEEIAEGMMIKMSLRDFKARYGEHRAIAALAVIVEDEAIGKKRMIHDATHGVRVNHRIPCRDKIRAPGAREKKQLLREMMEAKQVAFSVVGDILKAHRRFKHREEEHGCLGCQIDASEEIPGDPDSQTVYVNKVGTLGVSCASYWWTRISAAGAGIRATRRLLGPEFMLDLLLYADDLESLGLCASRRDSAKLLLYMSLLDFPFKWAKMRGVFCVEWLGLETEYNSYRLGLTKRRADWLVNWLRETVKYGSVTAQDMSQGPGRLGFAAKAGPMKILVMLRVG